MNTSVLPPEICAHICVLIDHTLLGPVCRVSRVFRDEGRRLLFQSVDLRLRSCDIKSVRSWCLAVIRHSHLAERVHTLSLQLPNELDPADAARISSALRKCVNLKSLAVFYDQSLPRTSASAYTWMLENCTFRLTAFTNSYFESGGLREFWDMQPDIRLLSFPEPGFCHLPTDSQLPNLIALRVADDLPLGFSTAINRPLQRIQMPFGSHISSLSNYSATLTTLNILLKLGPTAPIENVAMFVADALPALIHFGISDVSEVSSTRHWEINPTPALERFALLETLVLQMRSLVSIINAFLGDYDDFDLGTASDLLRFGLVIMEACPTLRKLTISSTRNSFILTRVRGLLIISEEGTGFDFDAVSEFLTD